MTDALRAEVDEYGVDAVLIEPGPVDTGFSERADTELDRLERSGAYESFYETFEDTQAIGGGGPGAVAPDRVADAVVNAASATQPAARVPVGALGRLGVLARFVPDRLRDRAFGLVDRLR
jgi:NAD(P)-dependent dehydrogenase (short-subunit alcohol dehydrogenase family)